VQQLYAFKSKQALKVGKHAYDKVDLQFIDFGVLRALKRNFYTPQNT